MVNLKEEFHDYGWDSGFKFEVIWSQAGGARVYVGDRRTGYYEGGGGYDKESAVIAAMINDLLDLSLPSCGAGFESVKASFESVPGYKLSKIYSGKHSNVYSIRFK